MVLRPLPSLIDHTVLRPETTKADVVRACEEAQRYGFVVVFVAPCYVDHAVAALAGTRVQVGAPIGFPHGSQTTRTKVGEAVEACKRGATELDMVLNIGRLKSGTMTPYGGRSRSLSNPHQESATRSFWKPVISRNRRR